MNFSRLSSPKEMTQHRLPSERAEGHLLVLSGSGSLRGRMQSRAILEVDQMK